MNGTRDEAAPIRGWEMYAASGIGAFILAFGDLLNQTHNGAVVRLGLVLVDLVGDLGIQSALLALSFIVLLGVLVSWLHQPRTRVDAFARGLSVLALLSVASPDHQKSGPPAGANLQVSIFESAYADEVRKATALDAESIASAELMMRMVGDGGNPITNAVHVDVLDARSDTLILNVTQLSPFVSVKVDPGTYRVTVSAPGYWRIEGELQLEDGLQVYDLTLPESKVPVGIQHLTEPRPATIDRNPNEELKILGKRLRWNRQFASAKELYAQALELDPEDTATWDYKGYAEFRMGDYGEAIHSFKMSLASDASNWRARLNLIKTYCATGDLALAAETYRDPASFTDEQRAAIAADGEFRRVCRNIL